MWHRIWLQFWNLVDSDSVRPFIWLYYIPLMLWGVYATFVADPIPMLLSAMGPMLYEVWSITPILGTGAAMLGLWLRHGGSSFIDIHPPLLRRDWLGLWLQLGGHLSMCMVLLALEVSFISEAYWGQPIISAFALSSYCIGTFLLSLQCGRKLWRGELLTRQLLEGVAHDH